MKKNEIYEASAAVDTAVGTVRDIASPASAGAMVAQYVPKLPAAIKTFGKKAFPVANAVYQASDAAKRALAGDEVGATIAGAAAIPVLSIPGAMVQAGRDKVRTGSFSPSDDEIKTAAKKDKEAGGYWKARGSEYDPSYMPEGKVMKNRLQVAIIKEELTLKKCSMTEEQIRNTLFIYKDRQGNLFTESGKHIDQSRLDEVANPLPAIGQGLKTGWNAVKAGGEWAAKNIPPAYRATSDAVKTGGKWAGGVIDDTLTNVGKGVDWVGSKTAGGIDRVGAVGNYIADKAIGAKKKYQDLVHDTDGIVDAGARQTHMNTGKLDKIEIKKQAGLGQTKVDTARGVGQQTVRGAKGDADVKVAAGQQALTAAEIAAIATKKAKNELPFHQKHPIITGAGVTAVAADTALRYDSDKDKLTGGIGSGVGDFLPEETYAEKLKKWWSGDKPAAPATDKPAKPEPAKPEPAKPEPAKPEPAKPEPAKPEPAKPEPAKPEPAKPEPAKPEPAKPEPAKPEPAKPTNTANDKVIAMQKKLKAAGYDIGTFGAAGDGIDGKWGKRTQAAYDAYKADKNLKRAGQPDAASRERERIVAQSNAAQAPAGTNVNKIDVKDLQTNYPRAAAVAEPVTRSTPWGGIQTPTDAIEKVIQAGQGRGQELARIRSQSLEPTSEPALNTNSVPYATDAKATADRDRVGAAAKAAAALMKEELQDMLRLSGLQGK